MKSLIVMPTFNEKENIQKIIPTILSLYEDVHILIVDDNSPDGTGQIVESMAIDLPRIKIMHRAGKMGLGTAYIAGFKYAIEHGYDFVFEMDADFSHDPKDLKHFFDNMENYDLILGSRYIPDGKIVGWGPVRYFISVGGNIFTRVVLGVSIKDCTSGFRVYKTAKLKELDFDKITTEGYGFQVEILYYAYKKGFKIKEVPITFIDRQVGNSKMSKKIVFEALKRVIELRTIRYD